MYHFLRNCFFKLDAELSHSLALRLLPIAQFFKLFSFEKLQATSCMGINFPNPVGLAAGLDKNGDYVSTLAALGFGFIEIGTVTPKPQAGNPKPRLFRLVKEEAIINRMGFNSKGMDYVAQKLSTINYNGILGINIGKNKETSLDNAIDDYLFCFKKLWPFASYFTVNISSPNTPNLRKLQHSDYLEHLINCLKQQQTLIAINKKKYIPLVIKISPDLILDEISVLAELCIAKKIDGIIATNTTTARDNLISTNKHEAGGLSGRPLQSQSTTIIRHLHQLSKGSLPIIASGGIMDTQSAKEKLQAGATLLQIYSGLIYKGPRLVRTLLRDN